MNTTDIHAQLHEKLLSNEGYLTRQQQEVVTHDGHGVVRACPGSGKTRALAARVAYRMSKWESRRSGIAALSFTNVAVEELKGGLRELGVEVPDANPHFIGTIDSFIYQHITGPHLSSLIPDVKSRPEPMPQGQDAWVAGIPACCIKFPVKKGKRKFRYPVPVTRCFVKPSGDIDWHPTRMEQNMKITLPDAREVIRKKHSLAKSGHISISDSMYYAYRILSKYPKLTEGLASRYPQIVIDECQDTSDVQHKIISLFVATGKTHVLLIGDPYQAIYEFNDANPQLMQDRIESDHWHEIQLTVNFRSSEKICKGITSFFSFGRAMDAKGYSQCCQIEPLLLCYPDNEVGELPSLFFRITNDLAVNCEFKDIKIVARSNSAVRELRRLDGDIEYEPNYCTKHLIAAATNRDNGLWAEAFQEAQTCLCRLLFDRASLGYNREPLGDRPYKVWRQFVWSIVTALPDSNRPLSDWISEARESVKHVMLEAGIDPHCKPSNRIKCPKNCPDIPAASIVAAGGVSNAGSHIDTVHKVKGQTLDGIMLVASPQAKSRKSSVYNWLPDGKGNGTTEEQRIAYVAMTRPRKLLVVAVPESAWAGCAPQFSGFRKIDEADISNLHKICSGCNLHNQ